MRVVIVGGIVRWQINRFEYIQERVKRRTKNVGKHDRIRSHGRR